MKSIIEIVLILNLNVAFLSLVYLLCKRFFQDFEELKLHRLFFYLTIIAVVFPFFNYFCNYSVDLTSPVLLRPKDIERVYHHTVLKRDKTNINLREKEIRRSLITQVDIKEFLLGMIFLSFLFSLSKVIRQYLKIRKILVTSLLYKRYRGCSLYISEDLKIPFVFSFLSSSSIVFPYELVNEKEKLKVVLAHEFQHIRNRDAYITWAMEVLKCFLLFNPFVRILEEMIYHYLELRCDKEVLKKVEISTKKYAHVLVSIAISNQKAKGLGPFALAMASYNNQQIVRRIKMLSSKTNTLSKRVQQRSVFKLVTLMIFSLCFVWKSAWAKYSLIQYRPLTYQEAKSLLLKKGTIPLELNEAVLKWLNYFLSDPKGRMYTLNSLERMRSYESFIKEKLKSEGMPFELLGVPFIESGFVGERTSPAGARGLWSFMPQTARKYGLKVDLKNGFDERLSVDKLTYAAIHYYKDLLTYKSFRGDWRFALLAYNVGENRLARAIEERGSSNPWDYSDLGDKEYLAKIFAGMIIVQNSSHSHFGSPLKNLKVTSSFGFRDNPLDKESHSRDFHEGLDLKAHEGDSVFSPMAGEVKQIKQVKGAGSFVVIDHGDGVETRFRHIGNLLIKKGDTVEKKQVIGEVAQTELSTGAHLHVEVLLNGRHVDPEPFF